MLNNFFRINLPYGIARNGQGEWMAFNREYMPLGYNDERHKGDPGESFGGMPIYTKYVGLSEKLISQIADDETAIQRNEMGDAVRIFLYDDRTNPTNQPKDDSKLWSIYFSKLKKLSELKTKEAID